VAERERRLEMFCELSKTSLLRTDGERGFYLGICYGNSREN